MKRKTETIIITLALLIVVAVGTLYNHTSFVKDRVDLDDRMVDINGTFNKKAGLRETFRDNGGVILKNGYIAGVYPETSTDYEYKQIRKLKKFLDGNGIDLLYVNKPTKYTDDKVIADDLGLESYTNRNADHFLSRISKAGIHSLDLREKLNENDSFSYFYRTDHHWTVPAGKEGADAIASELEKDFGYEIDHSISESKNFKFKTYKSAWLGEQGKKMGRTYVGLDDFTLVTPRFDTSFTVSKRGKTGKTGPFSKVLVNKKAIKKTLAKKDSTEAYHGSSLHYSYNGNKGRIINNGPCCDKKILVLGDSYDTVTNAFLALYFRQVDSIIMRTYKKDLHQFILDNGYDTVIVSYAQFMIGAHDKEDSANRRMFAFQ